MSRSTATAAGKHEREHKEGIECCPELLGVFNVFGGVPQEEFVPGFFEELLAEFLQSVREERGHENAFGRPQLYAPAVFLVLGSETALLELAPATARARFVATR